MPGITTCTATRTRGLMSPRHATPGREPGNPGTGSARPTALAAVTEWPPQTAAIQRLPGLPAGMSRLAPDRRQPRTMCTPIKVEMSTARPMAVGKRTMVTSGTMYLLPVASLQRGRRRVPQQAPGLQTTKAQQLGKEVHLPGRAVLTRARIQATAIAQAWSARVTRARDPARAVANTAHKGLIAGEAEEEDSNVTAVPFNLIIPCAVLKVVLRFAVI